MSEWKEIRLNDLVEDIIDRRGVTPLKLGSDFTTSGYRVISAKVVKNNRIELSSDDARYVDKSTYLKWMKTPLRSDDVILTSEAPIGETAYIIQDVEWCLGQRLFCIRTKKDILHGRFLFYSLQDEQTKHELFSRATGTTAQGISQESLRQALISVPPLSEQKAIASILSSLDDKIELNRRMNETLEAMARAIFKDWFVDFGPTRANQAGLPPYLPEHIWSLFPEAIDVETGLPIGWKPSTIGEEVTIFGGATPSTKEPKFWNGDIHWATPKDLSSLSSPVLLDTGRKITTDGLNQISSGLLPKGTVLLSSRAPVGYIAISEVPISINQGFIAMCCQGSLSNLFIWLWTKENMETIIQNANGSTFLEISKKNFRPIPIITPTVDALSEFDKVGLPIYQKICCNEKESRTLAEVRDRLLPKLMSGEIRVKDAEQMVEEVM